jgi:hypothetical protein
MLKLVLKLLLFALLIGASMQAMFVGARSLETLYYEDSSYAWVNHLSVKPKIVILGSSTALYNMSPREFCTKLGLRNGEVINMGMMQRGSIDMYHFWNTIEQKRDSVKIVLMTIDPWLGYESYDWIVEFPTLYWSPWQRVYTVIDSGYPHSVLSGVAVTNVVKKSVRQLYASAPSLETPGDYGSVGMPSHVNNLKETARGYFGDAKVYPVSELYMSRMAMLKRSVEQHGATFVLVLPPKQRVWLDGYNSECHELDADFVNHLNAALGPTRVIGSFAQFSANGDDTLFVDHDHLTTEGARRFSDSIALHLPKVLASKPAYMHSLSTY